MNADAPEGHVDFFFHSAPAHCDFEQMIFMLSRTIASMDFFGFSLWTELMMNDPNWVSSLNLPLDDENEFVPDKAGWETIFDRLSYSIEESGLKGKVGGCLHTSSGIPSILQNTGLQTDFQEALQDYKSEHLFEFGMHSTFDRPSLICGGDYYHVLKRDFELCRVLKGVCIVEHPPVMKVKESPVAAMIAELTSEKIIGLVLKFPEISLSWENMGGNKTFASLHNLVEFREILEDTYKEMGYPELIPRHNFCLDTGHLLLACNKHKKYRRELDESLPQFAKYLKVFHIHANNSKSDNHIIPASLEFFEHKVGRGSRKRNS